MTQTEAIGFCSQVAQLLEENVETLRELGLDVSTWASDLKAKRDIVTTKNVEQDELKAKQKAKTAEIQEAQDDMYKTSSTRLDAVVGVLGKTTPLAKQAARIRSIINKKNKRDTKKE